MAGSRIIAIYRPTGEVQRVVLFLSGDQGWNEKLSRSAQLLASQGALVAGIDSRAPVRKPGKRCSPVRLPRWRPGEPESFSAGLLSPADYEPAVLVGDGLVRR
jgi:hypothetical protein